MTAVPTVSRKHIFVRPLRAPRMTFPRNICRFGKPTLVWAAFCCPLGERRKAINYFRRRENSRGRSRQKDKGEWLRRMRRAERAWLVPLYRISRRRIAGIQLRPHRDRAWTAENRRGRFRARPAIRRVP